MSDGGRFKLSTKTPAQDHLKPQIVMARLCSGHSSINDICKFGWNICNCLHARSSKLLSRVKRKASTKPNLKMKDRSSESQQLCAGVGGWHFGIDDLPIKESQSMWANFMGKLYPKTVNFAEAESIGQLLVLEPHPSIHCCACSARRSHRLVSVNKQLNSWAVFTECTEGWETWRWWMLTFTRYWWLDWECDNLPVFVLEYLEGPAVTYHW